MARPKKSITKRQQHWLDHINAAEASADTLVVYAATHKLKVKDLYQWKTALTRRGFLPEKKPKAAFVPVAKVPAKVASTDCSVTLPNGVCVQFTGDLDGVSLREIMTVASRLA
ncbi:MAG: hypothetical protein AAF465_07740 [Pseudomonadota bacterium]